jgi:hypothetical protein
MTRHDYYLHPSETNTLDHHEIDGIIEVIPTVIEAMVMGHSTVQKRTMMMKCGYVNK